MKTVLAAAALAIGVANAPVAQAYWTGGQVAYANARVVSQLGLFPELMQPWQTLKPGHKVGATVTISNIGPVKARLLSVGFVVDATCGPVKVRVQPLPFKPRLRPGQVISLPVEIGVAGRCQRGAIRIRPWVTSDIPTWTPEIATICIQIGVKPPPQRRTQVPSPATSSGATPFAGPSIPAGTEGLTGPKEPAQPPASAPSPTTQAPGSVPEPPSLTPISPSTRTETPSAPAEAPSSSSGTTTQDQSGLSGLIDQIGQVLAGV